MEFVSALGDSEIQLQAILRKLQGHAIYLC